MNDPAPFRWGLAGYGDLAAKRVAAALRQVPGSQLCGVWGRNPERARQFAAQHHIPAVHASVEALAASEVDGIYVCTPADSHAEYALAAIAAGRHVLVEKPLATTVADCEKMVQLAAARGVRLGAAYYRRAFPTARRIKELIDGGLLGIPTWVGISCHSWYDPAVDDPKHWRVERNRSGGAGALADIGTHRLDLLDYWLGPAQLAFRDLQRLVHSYEVEDGSSLELRLKNGAPVQAYFAWNSKTFSDRFEIAGSEGKIIADPLDGPSFTLVRGRTREEITCGLPDNLHGPCVQDFIAAVREGREPLCSGADALRTNRLLAQILAGAAP